MNRPILPHPFSPSSLVFGLVFVVGVAAGCGSTTAESSPDAASDATTRADAGDGAASVQPDGSSDGTGATSTDADHPDAGDAGTPSGDATISDTGSDVGVGDASADGAGDSAVDGSATGDSAAGDAATDASADAVSDASQCTSCFLHGRWDIANVSPCIVSDYDGGVVGMVSTVLSGTAYECPVDPSALPDASWSSDTLAVDCNGTYSLCFTFKAGDPNHPTASDCVIAESCTASDAYTLAGDGGAQAFPDLPGWISSPSASACAVQFSATGGYGEFSVSGTATGCGTVSKVFGAVLPFCASVCASNPDASVCTPGCGSWTGGVF